MLAAALRYFAALSPSRIVLWCYLLWYLVTVCRYFDPTVTIWLNSLGISVIIGFALFLSVSRKASSPADPWQTFRLFLMPFCVSSFSSLIKGRGFFLILPPTLHEMIVSAGICAAFLLFVFALKHLRRGPGA